VLGGFSQGGTTSMEMFTFSSGETYMIRNGKVAETVRPVVLSGNVFSTLMHVDAIGNDLEMNQGGGCGKGGDIFSFVQVFQNGERLQRRNQPGSVPRPLQNLSGRIPQR
jgi:predicted Zn-dependent protease